jgi:hypothetical protein
MVDHVLRRYALIGAAAALALVTPNLSASTTQDVRETTLLPKELQQPQKNFSDDVPAHISVVDGQADLEHDGKVERAEANMILLAGDRLRTSRGRLEVLFDDGSALHLDENSTVDLLSASLFRLRAGRLRLLVARTSNPVEFRIDATAGSTLIRSAGEYRIAVAEGRSSDFDLRVIVLRGMAEVSNESGRTTARTGSEVFTSLNRMPSPPYSINSAVTDSFERWAQEQIDARLSVESARYLPEDVRYDAGVFDNYGSWGYESSYGGYAWYPNVAYGWRPYHYGKWNYYNHYGWTWQGYDRWSWATHHYGRWGYNANRWYWVPTAGWGPAWVAWGYAPGYVSWCPLGWGGYPVVGFTRSVYYGSIYGGPRYGPWEAWTVVPARSFVPVVNPHVVVAQHAVAVDAISPAVRTQFAEARRMPAAPNMAVSRAEPLRAPTGPRAVPRGVPSSGIAAAAERGGLATASSGGAASRTAPSRDAATSRTRVAPSIPASDGVTDPRAGSGIESSSPRSQLVEPVGSSAPRSRVGSSMPETNAPRARIATDDAPAPSVAPRSRIGTERQPATSRTGIGDPDPGLRSEPTESRSRSYSVPSAPRSEPIMVPSRSSSAPAPASGPPSRSGSGGAVSRPSMPSGGGTGGAAPSAAPSRSGGGTSTSSGSSGPSAASGSSGSSSSSSSAGAAAPRRGRGGV